MSTAYLGNQREDARDWMHRQTPIWGEWLVAPLAPATPTATDKETL
jgi:hypothetical protein